MDKRTQVDVFNGLYGGKVLDIIKNEGEISLIIQMSDDKNEPLSVLRCELINCTKFELITNDGNTLKPFNASVINYIELADSLIKFGDTIVVSCRVNNIRANFHIITKDIMIFDKDNKEVPLLQLSIFSGLCWSGTGIDFVIRVANKEEASSERYLKFDEGIHNYLMIKEKTWSRENTQEFDLLLKLDQYGDKEFNQQEIQNLLILCEKLIAKYHQKELNEQKVNYFAHKLREVCEEALQNNKSLFAFGD